MIIRHKTLLIKPFREKEGTRSDGGEITKGTITHTNNKQQLSQGRKGRRSGVICDP